MDIFAIPTLEIPRVLQKMTKVKIYII
jgi:hypothetical protein